MHVEALAKGGAHDISNFATICARCNARKGTHTRAEHLAADSPRKVKGEYREPSTWDGLASVFVLYARQLSRPLSASEQGWLRALEAHFARGAGDADSRHG
ncbi:MAG: HNH endonuclease [Gemmatimonadaceae bacterium]